MSCCKEKAMRTRTKKRLYGLYTILGFLLGIAILSGLVFQSVYSAQSYGQLINYLGLVRGTTQRLVKLELSGTPNDELIEYLDSILSNLESGEGEFGLDLVEDEDYLECLYTLQEQWEDLKADIRAYRLDPSFEHALLASSETYFDASNETVFTAEAYMHGELHRLLVVTGVLIAGIVLVWLLLFMLNFKRVLHLEGLNRDLNDKAGRDSLTHAYTLDRFKDVAQKLLEQRRGRQYAVFYMDFADFNYINDVFGYSWGDKILAQYASVLSEDMAEDEAFGRVNADNFVALRSYHTKEELYERQADVDRKITEFMLSSRDKHALVVRCGICCAEDVTEPLTIDSLIDRANYARKSVKAGTREGYCFYDEGIRLQLRAEKAIEHDMEAALRKHEFIVYYQPKVSPESDRITCSEALVRWRKPDGQMIQPGQFIPVFEKNHSIPLLDRYVFESVCIWLRRMLDEGKPALPVSVNVSCLQFYSSDFVKTYREIRDRYRIPRGLLEIEFTETILFDDWHVMNRTVKQLKDAGFICSIDDFGKGYSSLSTVKNLDIDVLKLDAVFFQDTGTLEKDRQLVAGIIHMVRQLGITTVAEGIETWEQVEFLRGIRCDLIQGYVYYKPMPQEEYEALLINESGEYGRDAGVRQPEGNAKRYLETCPAG